MYFMGYESFRLVAGNTVVANFGAGIAAQVLYTVILTLYTYSPTLKQVSYSFAAHCVGCLWTLSKKGFK